MIFKIGINYSAYFLSLYDNYGINQEEDMSMNQVILVGRLVADPETKELESGKNVSNIVIAVTRNQVNMLTSLTLNLDSQFQYLIKQKNIN